MIDDDESILLLNAYLDGELSPAEALAMERRLAGEPALRAHYETMRGLSGKLKVVLPGEPVPEDRLRSRIIAEIGFSDAEPEPQAEPRPAPRYNMWPMALAASLVVGIGLGYVGARSYPPAAIETAGLSDMVLAAHLRGLAAQQPFDVASSDRHVVKPWFNGKTTISPKAPDLSADGFPLVGGRVDVVRQETVPTLVYNRRRHVISVTAVPDGTGFQPGEETRSGTNIVRWTLGNLSYVAVSDLNLAELRTFVDLFNAAR